MQQHSSLERSARVSASVAMIKSAIHDRVCLSGTHVEFRVRFAPHALGRDENGRPIVFGFEYGGLTLRRAHWVCFAVHRLRNLKRTADPWRSGTPENRPQFALMDIEAGVGDSAPPPIGHQGPINTARAAP